MEIQIAFEIVSATVCQRVKIVADGWNEENIVCGLRNGSLITTTWHGDGESTNIESAETGKVIARIISQEIDGEYEDFR